MKIVIAGGSGQVGTILARAFQSDGHEVVNLSRQPQKTAWKTVQWDAETLGDWKGEIDGADVLINLAGYSVNCRYNAANRRKIMDSRLKSTRILGQAIAETRRPPKIWLQSSTATIYAHRYDAPNDEFTGIIGGGEPNAPDTWNFSIDVAKSWEKVALESETPHTRKVLMRSAMIMSPDKDGVFDTLLTLVRRGLGGTAGDGRQFVSWIHEEDFIRAIYWIIENGQIAGAVNLAAPHPLPNREFMRVLRDSWGLPFGLNANKLMLEIGAFFMRTETELVLKSRRVVPGVLQKSGFKFNYPVWETASRELCQRWRRNNNFKKLIKVAWLITSLLSFPTFAQEWKKQTVETKASLRGLSVVDEKVVWASGSGGTFLKTTDGGKTWTVGKIPDAEKLDFRDIEAFDAKTAYVLSIGEGENSRIYKTTDGGTSWKLLFKNTNPQAFFDAFAFWDKSNGIAMSDPVAGKYLILETKDGENWKLIENMQMPPTKDGEAAFAASGTCLITHGKNSAFLISGGNDARVFRTENRGLSWTVFDTPIVKGTAGSGIFSIAMNGNQGIIVGGNYEKPDEINPNLALTRNGGKSWTAEKGLGGFRSGVAYVDKKTLVAVGSSGSDFSTDGGKSWKNLDRENYNAVQAKNKNSIWAVGARGLVVKLSMP